MAKPGHMPSLSCKGGWEREYLSYLASGMEAGLFLMREEHPTQRKGFQMLGGQHE